MRFGSAQLSSGVVSLAKGPGVKTRNETPQGAEAERTGSIRTSCRDRELEHKIVTLSERTVLRDWTGERTDDQLARPRAIGFEINDERRDPFVESVEIPQGTDSGIAQ